MFGLKISTVTGASGADILDAQFSFPVTSIDTSRRLNLFRQRFQVFYTSYLLDYLCVCKLLLL